MVMEIMKISLEDLRQLEEEERVFQQQAEQIVEMWKAEIEMYIQDLSDENADKLIELFDKDSSIHRFCRSEEIYYVRAWVALFKEERRAGIKHTIFTEKKSIQEVTAMWRKAYFLLWRVELEKEEYAKEQFFLFLEKEKISVFALQYLLYMKAVFFEKTGVWLVREFLKMGNYTYADAILSFLKQNLDERMMMEL